MSWHPNTQQAVSSKREASWRNFVKNDTYSAAADASRVRILKMKCVAKHQSLSLDWQPRNPIFWLTFVMAISLYTPKQSKIDIVWHSMTQYKWQKHGESEDLPSRLGPKWSSWLLTAPVGFHLQSEWPGRSLLGQDLHLSRGHQSEVSNLSGKTHGLT